MKRPDPKAAAVSLARGVGASLAKRESPGQLGINVRSDTKAGVRYADEIVDGNKKYETRDSDSLRPYVNRRMAIVRTGEGPAVAIGEATIGEPIVADRKLFHQLRDQHLVPEGSTFDIKPGSKKYLYPIIDPRRFDAEKSVGTGIVARKVIEKATGGVAAPAAPDHLSMLAKAADQQRGNPEIAMTQAQRAIGGPVEDTLLDSTGKPVHHTPEGVENFRKFHEGSKVVDENGNPLVVYHGTASDFPAFDLGQTGKTYGKTDEKAFFFTGRIETAESAADDATKLPYYYSKYAPEGMDGERQGRYIYNDDVSKYPYHHSSRTHGGQNIMPVYLSIKNPMILDADEGYGAGSWLESRGETPGELIQRAKENGHDGIIIRGKYRDSERRSRIRYNDSISNERKKELLDQVAQEDAQKRKSDQYFIAFQPEQIKSAVGNDGTYDHPTDITKAEGGPVEDTLLDSTGKPVHHTPEGVKNFRQFHEGSKVVDEQGRPLVVYHGTYPSEKDGFGNIESFNRNAITDIRGLNPRLDTVGSWFSTRPDSEGAEMYGNMIYPAYLSIKNPYKTTFNMMARRAHMLAGTWEGYDEKGVRAVKGRPGAYEHATATVGKKQVDALRKWLSDSGRDGIHIVHDPNGSDEFKHQDAWIALEPEQIKSAVGNTGEFSPESKLITKARGGQVETVEGPEREQNLKNWLGDSLLHDNGVPRTYYHGTSKDKPFTSFNVGRHGAWFTSDPEDASSYAHQNDSMTSVYESGRFVDRNTASRVMPVYLKASNPFLGDRPEKYRNAENYKKAQSDWFDELRAAGYDSWIPQSEQGRLAVMLGGAHQIKSAIGNDGTFDHPSNIAKAEGGEVEPEGGPVLHTSVPNDEWLKSKQEHVASGGRHPSGAFKRFGSTTGYFRSGPEHEGRRNVMMPVPLLASIPGVMEEQKNVRQHALDWLTDEMGRTGRLPLNSSGEEYAPHVWVNHEGEAFVAEGNHRIMAAQKLGMTHLPVELEYVNGGERVNGPFHPDRILAMHREATSADREGKAEGGQIDQPDRPLAPAATAPQREKYLEGSQVENQRFVEGHDPRLVFHATASTPFNEFNPERSDLGIHVGSLVHAQDRLKSKGNVSDDGVLEQARVIPLYAKAKNLLRMEDHGNFQPANVISQLEDQGILSEKDSTQMLKRMREQSGPAYPYGIKSSVGERVLREHLKGLGYDGVVYLNRGEGMGKGEPDYSGHVPRDMMSGDYDDQDVLRYYPDAHDSYILFDAGQVKSPHASDYDESEKDYLKASGGEVEGDDEWTEVYPLEPKHAEKFRRDEKAEGGDVEGPIVKAEGGEVDGQPPAQPVQPAPPARKFNSIGLYSHAAEQALKLPQTRGSLDQMLGALKNKGVKQDEIFHSGVEQQFDGRPSVTKQELADHFNANMPEFSPQTDTSRYKDWALQKDEENRQAGGELAGKNYREHLLRLTNPSSILPFRESHWPDVSNIVAHLRTQDFVRGKNKAEVPWEHPDLDTVVRVGDDRNTLLSILENRELRAKQTDIPGLIVHKPVKGVNEPHEYSLTHARSAITLLNALPYHAIRQFVDDIKPLGIDWSKPWSEIKSFPQDLINKITQTRHNWEQSYPNPKPAPAKRKGKAPKRTSALFLDEVQSDWGQKSRKRGIVGVDSDSDEWKKELEDLTERHRKAILQFQQDRDEFENVDETQEGGYEKLKAAGRKKEDSQNTEFILNRAVNRHKRTERANPVPNGPYIDSTEKWTDLSLKYALKKAVDEGRSHLVWTPSKVQTGRSMSQARQMIDSFKVVHHASSGTFMIQPIKDHTAVHVNALNNEYLFPKEIEKIFGKELTDLVTQNNPDNEIDYPLSFMFPMARQYRYDLEDNVDIGKSGQEFMYDKLIPKRLLALARQHDPDAKLTTYQGEHEPIKGFPALEITPAMAKSIKENGFKAFKRGGAVGGVDHALRVARKARGMT